MTIIEEQIRNWAAKRRNALGKPPALLLDMGVPGLALARHLGRQGISVLAFDTKPKHWSHRSRYVDVISSDYMREPEILTAAIRLVHTLTAERPVVFPLHDDFARLMAEHADELSEVARLQIQNYAIVEKLIDKDKTAEVCEKLGISIPRTVAVSSTDDLEAVGRTCTFPCIIKPIESRRWQTAESHEILGSTKVLQVEDMAQLREEYQRVTPLTPDVVVQEIVPGPDRNLYYVVSYVDHSTRPVGIFIGQKIRTYPPGFGRGCWVRSVSNEQVESLARLLLSEVGYRGNIGIEFKYDPRDGSYKLIEINCRFGLWDGFAEDCNVRVASAAYADLAGLPVPNSFQQKNGKYWLNPESDLWAGYTYIRSGELSAIRWMADYLRPHYSSGFTWDDPIPGVALWGTLTSEIIGKLYRRLTG